MNTLPNSTETQGVGGQCDNPSVAPADTPTDAPATANAASGNAFGRVLTGLLTSFKDTLSDARTRGSLLLLGSIVAISAFGGYLLGLRAPAGPQGMVMMQASFSNQVDKRSGTGIGNGAIGTGADKNADAPALPDQRLQPSGSSLLFDANATAQSASNSEISHQLGQLRAELLRLHSVFAHLAELAELDDGEFDLEAPLLQWQEQSTAQQLDLLKRRIAHISASSATMKSIFDTRRMAYDQKISGEPLHEGYRTSGYGVRTDPITGEQVEHFGLDFSGPVGEPILALADGLVTFSGKNSGYGNLVELEHVDGLRTRYAHNQANLVARGARVKKGEPIATLGSTGRSTGPHVHIEVRQDGAPMDPSFFIR